MTTPDPGRTLKIVHPQTGEMIDLITAEDIELGQLLSEHYEIERIVRTNIRVIQGEIERRGREGGYNDGKRRVYGKWDRVHRAVWAQVQEVEAEWQETARRGPCVPNKRQKCWEELCSTANSPHLRRSREP